MVVPKTATTNSTIKSNRKTRNGLYTPFRALGYVTNNVPLSLQARGSAFFITTSIGESFQIYNLEKMNLLFVGQNAPSTIQSIASVDDYTFAACGPRVLKYKRGKIIGELVYYSKNLNQYNDNHSGDNSSSNDNPHFEILQMLVLGDILLAACDDNTIRIWNHRSGDFYNELGFPSNFQISFMMHPSTYVNKILVSSREGRMQIWNINSMKMIYDFPNHYPSPITFIAQSPVMDVVAIGLLDGQIFVHNIKADKKIIQCQQEGKVTGISFRTDNVHMMATSNNQGDVCLWDLEEGGQLFHNMKSAHEAIISSLHFLNGQPILLTAGADNAVKQWIFDTIDGKPRLLKYRSGHYAPPSKIRFYGNDGRHLLSIARDRSLRFFSTIRDSQNCELSQGSLEKKSKNIGVRVEELKLSQPISFDSSSSKRRQWDDIITCHMQSPHAKTWNFQNKSIGQHSLPTLDQGSVKTVAMSYCGNFGFIGSSLGSIAMYNIQSGALRKSFYGHSKSITGIATDNLTRILVSSSLDGTLKFWDIQSQTCIATIEMPASASQLEFHGESGLIGFVCDDMCVRVVDFFTKIIVREFWGHRNRITDLAFSPDGRWLVSSSMDATIRTWDLPSGDLIDCFRSETVPISIAFSPTGDFLASAHVNHVGIFLWANKAQYQSVSLRRVDDEEVYTTVQLPMSIGQQDPSSSIDEGNEIVDGTLFDKMDGMNMEEQDEDNLVTKMKNSLDLNDDMIVMSSVPSSRWQILLNLEAIKKRNKPKAPPKAPEKAPFFLPTIDATQPEVDLKHASNDSLKAEEIGQQQAKNRMDMNGPISDYTRLLRNIEQNVNCAKDWFTYLKSLSPSAADLEIRMMEVETEPQDVLNFIEGLNEQILTGKDIELVNVFLNVFLKIHGDEVIRIAVKDNCVRGMIEKLQENMRLKWELLDSKISFSLSLMDFIKNRR